MSNKTKAITPKEILEKHKASTNYVALAKDAREALAGAWADIRKSRELADGLSVVLQSWGKSREDFPDELTLQEIESMPAPPTEDEVRGKMLQYEKKGRSHPRKDRRVKAAAASYYTAILPILKDLDSEFNDALKAEAELTREYTRHLRETRTRQIQLHEAIQRMFEVTGDAESGRAVLRWNGRDISDPINHQFISAKPSLNAALKAIEKYKAD